MPKSKQNLKPNFSVRVSEKDLASVNKFSERMKRERSDVFREALSLGLPFLECPEYYACRLRGISTDVMMREVQETLKKLCRS